MRATQPRVDAVRHAWRGAGPPSRFNVTSAALGLSTALILAALFAEHERFHDLSVVGWLLLVSAPAIALTFAAWLDASGWVIRAALLEFAHAAIARSVGFPRTPEEMHSWIDATGDGSTPRLDVAAVKLGFHDTQGAKEAVEGSHPSSPVEVARAAFLIAQIECQATGLLDMTRARELANVLDPSERRYRILAIAIVELRFNIDHERPWRDGLAAAVQGLAPFHLSKRDRASIAWSQCRFAIIVEVVALALSPSLVYLAH
jgi:hypothetical protein